MLKIKKENFIFGIDTIQVNSPTESEVTKSNCGFLSKDPIKVKDGQWQYVLNPDKESGKTVVCYSDFIKSYNRMTKALQLNNPRITRVDYRLDTKLYEYSELRKLNALLINLLSLTFSEKYKNRYNNSDTLTPVEKAVKFAAGYYAGEFYNKAVEEPQGDIEARLEVRLLKPFNGGSIDPLKGFNTIVNKFNEAVKPEYFKQLEAEANYGLYSHFWQIERRCKCSVNQFLFKYQEYLFTQQQIKDLLVKYFGCYDYSEEKKQALTRRVERLCGKYEAYSRKDIEKYINIFINSGKAYFKN